MRLCRAMIVMMVNWQAQFWRTVNKKWTDLFQQAIEDRGGILQPVTFIHNEALPWKPVKK